MIINTLNNAITIFVRNGGCIVHAFSGITFCSRQRHWVCYRSAFYDNHLSTSWPDFEWQSFHRHWVFIFSFDIGWFGFGLKVDNEEYLFWDPFLLRLVNCGCRYLAFIDHQSSFGWWFGWLVKCSPWIWVFVQILTFWRWYFFWIFFCGNLASWHFYGLLCIFWEWLSS